MHYCWAALLMGEGCTAGRDRGGLLGESGGKVDSLGGEGCAAGREINGLLGGGGLCCWLGKKWSPCCATRRESGGMLGERGLCCWSGTRWTAMRVVAVLLGARVVGC